MSGRCGQLGASTNLSKRPERQPRDRKREGDRWAAKSGSVSARSSGRSAAGAPLALVTPPTEGGGPVSDGPASRGAIGGSANERGSEFRGLVGAGLAERAGATLVRLDPPIGLPNRHLGDLKRLRFRFAHPTPPASSRLAAKLTRTTLPLRSSPITGPSSLLRSGPPLCPASLLSPSQICCLGFSLQTTDRRPQPLHWPAVPSGRQVPEFRTRAQTTLAPPSMPDTHLASQQAPARLIPGQ